MTVCPRCRQETGDRPTCARCGTDLADALDTAPMGPLDGSERDETAFIPALTEEPPQRSSPEGRRQRIAIIATGSVLVLAAFVTTVLALQSPVRSGSGEPALPVAAAQSSSPASSGAPRSSSRPTSPSRTPSPTRPSSSAPPAAELAQARAVTGYLRQSAAARTGINEAISAIAGCRAIPDAVRTLDHAASTRSGIVTRLGKTTVDAIPNGHRLVSELADALRISASADHHYAAWGRTVRHGCKHRAPHTADFTAAEHDDVLATAAKRRFTADWNPLARHLGLPAQDPNGI